MKGAVDARNQIGAQQKLEPNKIYEEELKKASHQIVMEKNEYAKFTNPPPNDSVQHNYFSNRNRAQKALYEGSRKRSDGGSG